MKAVFIEDVCNALMLACSMECVAGDVPANAIWDDGMTGREAHEVMPPVPVSGTVVPDGQSVSKRRELCLCVRLSVRLSLSERLCE